MIGRIKIQWLLLVCLVGLMSASCDEPFDPYWRVVDFRLLGVRSDLPVLKPNETASLDALVSADEEDVSYQWEWCPITTSASDKYNCPIAAEDLNALLEEQTGTPGDFNFNLGTAPTASFAYPAPQVVIGGLCQALQQALAGGIPGVPVVNCKRGLDVSIRLTVQSGGKAIVSSKKVNLWLGSDQPNQNPDVSAIQIRPTKAADATWMLGEGADWVVEPSQPKDNWWVEVDAIDPPEVWAGITYEVRSIVDPESVDIWEPPAPQGSEVERLPAESENLVFRWMTTAGSIDSSKRIYDIELNELDEASITEYKFSKSETEGDYDDDGVDDGDDDCPYVADGIPDAGGACPVTLWSIVRDGRLGIDWHESTVRVVGVRK